MPGVYVDDAGLSDGIIFQPSPERSDSPARTV